MTSPVTSIPPVLAAYQAAANAFDIERCVALFAPDATIVTSDGTVYQGSAEVRAAHEHDVAVRTQFTLDDCIAADDEVSCVARLTGEVERLLAIEPEHHLATFTLRDDRIVRFATRPGDEAVRARRRAVLRRSSAGRASGTRS